MDKFIKDIKKFSITLDCQKTDSGVRKITYDLIYEVNEYELLDNQDKHYIRKLRKNKVKIKTFKFKTFQNGKQKVQIYYYKLYSHKRMTNDYIKKRVDSIFNKTAVCDGEEFTNDLFIKNQIAKRVHKKKSTPLNGEYEKIFTNIGHYLAMQWLEYDKDYYEIKRPKEEVSLEKFREKQQYKTLNRYEKKRINQEKHKKWLKRHNAQVKRWKSSKTFKQNNYWNMLGLTDPSLDYKSQWCLVNTNNIFTFNNHTYQIDQSLKQYQVRNIPSQSDDYSNESEMEKVLCCEQNNQLYFFDENVNDISNYILKIL